MDPTGGAKKRVRSEQLAAIRATDPNTRSNASAELCARLADFAPVKEARSLLGFAPLGSEPDISPLLEALRAAGHTVILPRVKQGSTELELIELTGALTELTPDAMGVRAPDHGQRIPLSEIEVALIPGVAFDQRGNRLGRGGGFYDRLLANASGITTIGICFDSQLLEQIPTEPHDAQVDHVSTERRLLADLQIR